MHNIVPITCSFCFDSSVLDLVIVHSLVWVHCPSILSFGIIFAFVRPFSCWQSAFIVMFVFLDFDILYATLLFRVIVQQQNIYMMSGQGLL